MGGNVHQVFGASWVCVCVTMQHDRAAVNLKAYEPDTVNNI